MSDAVITPVIPPTQVEAVAESVARSRAAAHAQVSALTSLQSLCVTLVIAIFVISFVVQAFQIPSQSMENTLLIGDYLLVDKVQYGQHYGWNHLLPYDKIQRNEVIVFRWPVHPEQHFVKRVVGVPGDRIKLVHGRVLVNGTPLRDGYAVFNTSAHDVYRDEFPAARYSPQMEASWAEEKSKLTDDGELLVPEDSYFVLGDNRNDSLDSRYWGFVPRENIIGRPLMIYWSVKAAENSSANDKIGRFEYAIWHLPEVVRWHRTFRLVR
jgi:signal peptidase I